jgi:anti-sigma regulatory factor (Ser/Thr protein kinase)
VSLADGGCRAAGPWHPGQDDTHREIRDECFHMAMPSRSMFARIARRRTAGILREWGAPGDVIDTAELLASELVANAARFSPADITLTLWRLPGMLVIEVSDQAAEIPEAREPDADSVSGRGLVLVGALSREWSYYFPRPGWKTVYAVIDTGPPWLLGGEESYQADRQAAACPLRCLQLPARASTALRHHLHDPGPPPPTSSPCPAAENSTTSATPAPAPPPRSAPPWPATPG